MRKTVIERRTKALEQQFGPSTPTPLIDGHRLSYHAAIRMVARRIEIEWLCEALRRPGRPEPGGKFKHIGDYAMCVVGSNKTIITVGYGLLNDKDGA